MTPITVLVIAIFSSVLGFILGHAAAIRQSSRTNELARRVNHRRIP